MKWLLVLICSFFVTSCDTPQTGGTDVGNMMRISGEISDIESGTSVVLKQNRVSSGQYFTTTIDSIYSEQSGSFLFDVYNQGVYNIIVKDEMGRGAIESDIRVFGNVQPLNIEPKKEVWLKGKVVGNQVNGFDIYVSGMSQKYSTDGAGNYLIGPIYQGRMELLFKAKDEFFLLPISFSSQRDTLYVKDIDISLVGREVSDYYKYEDGVQTVEPVNRVYPSEYSHINYYSFDEALTFIDDFQYYDYVNLVSNLFDHGEHNFGLDDIASAVWYPFDSSLSSVNLEIIEAAEFSDNGITANIFLSDEDDFNWTGFGIMFYESQVGYDFSTVDSISFYVRGDAPFWFSIESRIIDSIGENNHPQYGKFIEPTQPWEKIVLTLEDLELPNIDIEHSEIISVYDALEQTNRIEFEFTQNTLDYPNNYTLSIADLTIHGLSKEIF